MNLYKLVKQVSCNDAAEYLKLKGKRTGAGKGMWCCPFHEDTNPSMACFDSDNRFYCFSCHARGDAADLFAKVGGMSLTDAARAVLYTFNIKVPLGQKYTPPAGCDRPKGKASLVRKDMVERIARIVRMEYRDAMALMLNAQAEAMTSAMDKTPDTEGWIWAHALQRACKVQEEAARWLNMNDDDLQSEIRARLRANEKPGWGDALPTPGRVLFRAILDDLERLARIPKLNLNELEATLDLMTMVDQPEENAPSQGAFFVGQGTKEGSPL